jgi:membrane protease YdiL (CAAX protease family)
MYQGAEFGRDAHLSLRTILVACSLLLVLPGVLAVLATGQPLKRALELRRRGPRTHWVAAALALGLWALSLGLLELQFTVWPPKPEYIEMFRTIHDALKSTGPLDWLWSLVAIAGAPAICEEILFRGIVLPSFRRFGTLIAIAWSAFLFAIIHFDPYRLLFTFVAGLVLGAIRVRADALGPSIVAHWLLNTLTFVAAPFLDEPTEPLPDPRPRLGAALLAAGLVATTLLLRLFRRVVPPPPSP